MSKAIIKSHGSGKFKKKDFAKIGNNVVIEPGVLAFHPENIEIGENVYIGHNTILKAYYKNKLVIKDDVWIGQNCFIHSAGGIEIGPRVGIGPGVMIFTAIHDLKKDTLEPINEIEMDFKPVEIKTGSDIGYGAIIMPGVTVNEGTQVGAGAVVTKATQRFTIYAGVPARIIRNRVTKKSQTWQERLWFLINPIHYLFDAIFFVLLPIIMIYSWSRYSLKKIFHLKPRVIFSPLGIPMSYLSANAVKTQGIKADVFAYTCTSHFRPISFGLILSDHVWLNRINYLTDYNLIFIWALLKYDLFENNFAGGFLFLSKLRKIEYYLLKLCAKKIIVYGYGSDCKFLSEVKKMGKYNNAMDRDESTESQKEHIIRENVQRAQKYADALIAGGDILHLGPKAVMLPLAVDLTNWQYETPKNNKIVTFVHSTNHRNHKGSRFIIDCFEKLKRANKPVKLLLIENKTVAECRQLYLKGDVFITDVVTGWHGLTACEAMMMGKPVITNVKKIIFDAHKYYAKDIPLVNANPDNLGKKVLELAKNFMLRKRLGEKGHEYVLKYHSFEFVGKLRSLVYEYAWAGKPLGQKRFEQELKRRKIL